MVEVPHIRVVLVEPEYEINIGYVARLMKNFGFNDLYLVNPKVKIGPAARMFAKHGEDILDSATIVKTLDEAIEDVDIAVGTTGVAGHDYLVHRICIPPWELKYALKRKGTIAIVFGRESIGLLNEEIEKMDVLVTIPANPEYPILNLSHAVAIILYEIYKWIYKLERKTKEYKLATRREREILVKYVIELMKEVGIQEYRHKTAEIIFRRALGRAYITKREYFTLIGVFRKAVEELKKRKGGEGSKGS